MKKIMLAKRGLALSVALFSLFFIFTPSADALLQPTRPIDPHAVSRALTGSDKTFVWTVTPKTSIPAVGVGSISSRVMLTGGSIGFSLKQSSLVFELNNHSHTGSYTGSDYQAVDSGATTSGSDSISKITYAYSLVTSTDYRITIDTTDSSWFTVKFKEGAGTEVTVGQFKRYSDFQSVGSPKTEVIYSNIDAYSQSISNCSAVTNTVEADVKLSIDGASQELAASPSYYTVCGYSLDTTSYSASTKTATLKQLAYNTGGVVLPKSVLTGSRNMFITRSLNTLTNSSDGTATFKDPFYPTASSDNNVYIQVAPNNDNDKDAFPIASANFDLSSSDVDFDSQNVTYDSKSDTYVAYVHNLNKLTKDGSFTLYIPYKTGDKAVGICPGVSSTGAISSQCAGIYYLKDGQSKGVVTANIVTVKNRQFWKVAGLTGTGGFSATTDGSGVHSPNTGINLGLKNYTNTILVLAFAGLIIIAYSYKQFTSRAFAKIRKNIKLPLILILIISTCGYVFLNATQNAKAWHLPLTGSILEGCKENNMVHAHIGKISDSTGIKIFGITVGSSSRNINVEGMTSAWVDMPYSSSSDNASIGFGDGEGHGAGADGTVADIFPDCLP